MYRHRYPIREGRVIEERDEVKECDLDEIMHNWHSTRPEPRPKPCPHQKLRQPVDGYHKKLKEGKHRSDIRVFQRQLLQCDRVAAASAKNERQGRQAAGQGRYHRRMR